jgi:hypothetical protein
MSWLPCLRWRALDRGEAHLLGLETPWRWEVLELSWLGAGITIMARAI